MPLGSRSVDASWARPLDVIGITVMPCSSMMNGYSLVPCGRAAIFDDAQTPRRKLIVDAVVEQDHAVGDVFLQAITRQRAFAALSGDDRRDALRLEPLEQPAQFGAQQLFVFQAAEQRLDGVDNDTFGADRVDGKAEPDEKTFEIIFAGLRDLGALDLDMVDGELLLGDQLLDVVVERANVLDEVFGLLFEGEEYAGLVVFDRRRCTGKSWRTGSCRSRPSRKASVGRPCGRPPWVTSSRPRMPVADLPIVGKSEDFARAFSAMDFPKPQCLCRFGQKLPHQVQGGKWLRRRKFRGCRRILEPIPRIYVAPRLGSPLDRPVIGRARRGMPLMGRRLSGECVTPPPKAEGRSAHPPRRQARRRGIDALTSEFDEFFRGRRGQ